MTVLMGLATRLRLARLYLCTDTRRTQGDLAEFVDAVFRGGVDIIQIREKGLSEAEELAALEVARSVAQRHQGIVCVNDNASLAGRFGADLLHLGQEDGSARSAKRRLHQWALVGRSTHSVEQADEAIADPHVDYFCVGPVYATETKPDYRPVGLDLVRYATRAAPPAELEAKPWFAIGGVDLGGLDAVLAAGARRVVVVRAITRAPDPEAAARAFASRLRESWDADRAMRRYALAALGADATP